MARAKFSGNSAYELDAVARRSGNTITVTVKVVKVSNYWAVWEGQLPWSVTIDGSKQSDTWNYDFRNTSSKTLGSKSRSGLSFGSKSWSVTVEMASGIGTATVSGSISIPPNQPIDPTLYGVDRVSDTRHTVRFRRRATSTAPYASMVLQRIEWVNGSWGTWRNIANWGYSSSATDMTYTDTGTVANKVYQYRVAAYNSAGSGLSGNSSNVYTTPAAPTSVVAESVSSTEVQVTLTHDVGYVTYETQLQYSSAGGAWTTLATLPRGTDTYTWEPPAAAAVQVRARNVATGPNLAGVWRNSNIVPLQAPPLAPSNLSPNGVSVDRTKATSVSWRHNSVDTSLQRSYEIQTKVNNGSWVSGGKVNSSASSATLPANLAAVGAVVYWQVRTWGVHADPGPWSTQASLTMANVPTVTIESPVGLASSSEALLEWSAVPGQSQYRAELYHNSTRVETRSGSGAATRVRFNTLLLNGENYKVRLQVQDSTGLWSAWQESEFLAEFPTPSPPRFTLAWDDERGATLVDIYNDVVGPQNLVTNPAMAAGSGYIGVLRNRFPNPRAIQGGTSIQGSANNNPVTDPTWLTGLQGLPHGITTAARYEAANPGTWWRVGHQGDAIKVQAGRTYTFSAWATINNPSIRVSVNVIWRNASGASIGEAPFDWRNISTWTRLSVTHTAPANADHVYVYVRGDNNAGAGNAMAATGFMVDEWPTLRGYVDGSTASADPDLENIWEGTPNASTSLARGKAVPGLQPNQVLVIWSEKFGGSARLIPTGSNNSYAELTGNIVPLGMVTALATLHLEAPLTGPLHERALDLNMLNPFTGAGAAPNEAGSYDLRMTDDTHNTGRLLLRHGGAVGSGDVYWSNVMVTPGEYYGDYGDGDMPGWVWDGTPNDSTSSRADTEDNLVYRSYDQETWELVQANVPPNATISDPEVVLNTEVFYRVVARSPLGTTEEGLIQSIFTEAAAGYWSVGEGFYLSVKLRMDLGGPPGIDLSSGLVNKERHYFAGRTLPVEYVGTARQRSGQAHFMVGSVAEKNQVEDMSYRAAPHLFRLPDGTYLYASISDVAMLRQDEGFYTVKLTATEVEK